MTITTLVLIQIAVFYVWNRDRQRATSDIDIKELRRTYAWITVANIFAISVLTAIKIHM